MKCMNYMLMCLEHDKVLITKGPGTEVIKLFSCSTQLSTIFQMLIKTKIPTNNEVSFFKSLRCLFIMLINVKMPTIVVILTFMSRIMLINVNNCWHFNICEQDKFRAQLS